MQKAAPGWVRRNKQPPSPAGKLPNSQLPSAHAWLTSTEVCAGSARLDVIKGITRSYSLEQQPPAAWVRTLVKQDVDYYSMCICVAAPLFQPFEGDGKCATMPPLETPSINQVQTKDTSASRRLQTGNSPSTTTLQMVGGNHLHRSRNTRRRILSS